MRKILKKKKNCSAHLCVDILTALSRTRLTIVLFSPSHARRAEAEKTGVGKRATIKV